jgi:hypothetical protein
VQPDSFNGMLQNSKLETPKIVNNLSLDFLSDQKYFT